MTAAMRAARSVSEHLAHPSEQEAAERHLLDQRAERPAEQQEQEEQSPDSPSTSANTPTSCSSPER